MILLENCIKCLTKLEEQLYSDYTSVLTTIYCKNCQYNYSDPFIISFKNNKLYTIKMGVNNTGYLIYYQKISTQVYPDDETFFDVDYIVNPYKFDPTDLIFK